MMQLKNLHKHYDATPVFQGVSLHLARGEFVALLGESGVGKSTLLNCIAGLDEADGGQVLIDGVLLSTLDDTARARLRRVQLGFVFQAFHVLPHLTVAQNVGLPLRLLNRLDDKRVMQVLQAVGLRELGERLPAQLSGGQLQRVAIARAVVHAPGLILADEPTGNLDPTTADKVMAVLRQQVREAGAACLLVTHSVAAAAAADRVLRLTPTGIEDATPQPAA
ncbi:MAG: ABC transporter ATP-binding protein [Rubrivivax sp.]|nr:ABC transporter ATP-binding protein [Rubrivivax sp.]